MKNILKLSGVLVLAILFSVTMVSCNKDDDSPKVNYSPETEAEQVQSWITAMKSSDSDIDTTEHGIYYVIDSLGTGDLIKTGDVVTVKYAGYFVNGTMFDTSLSRGDGTMTFTHKSTDPTKRMIPGWEEAMEVLNKGGKAIFIIPSSLAYGTDGYGPIPPYTPLVFVIDVIDVK